MARYSNSRILKLLARIDTAPNSDVKGDLLEELARYLFEKMPGVEFLAKNVLDGPRAHELDVVFWNRQVQTGLHFLDPVALVECKATNDPVGSMQVSWFVTKIKSRGNNCGVLIALSGITGTDNPDTSAHRQVVDALTADGVKVLILTREDLAGLRTTVDLIRVLTERYLQLTLYRTAH